MTLRRRAALGMRKARTQGAPAAALRARLRTMHGAAQCCPGGRGLVLQQPPRLSIGPLIGKMIHQEQSVRPLQRFCYHSHSVRTAKLGERPSHSVSPSTPARRPGAGSARTPEGCSKPWPNAPTTTASPSSCFATRGTTSCTNLHPRPTYGGRWSPGTRGRPLAHWQRAQPHAVGRTSTTPPT